ncbi:hypothetical protein ACIBHX_02220 [Nonomuraea sp. NPDC050536]|uniref:hypothetical protein n=1 Tax=Nonomuraea sp. NPDC050536 TaxID=3364366 RepID=UPI0037C71BEF
MDINVLSLVSGTPVDHFSSTSPADWLAWIWARIAPYLPPPWFWWIVLGLIALLAIRRIGRILRRAASTGWSTLKARPVEDVLTVVAASIATAVSAQGMWRFSGDVLGLDGPLRLLLFAFIEVAIITSAVRARRNMRENYTAGIDGIAVWALTCLTAVLSSMDAHSLPEAVFRLAAPLVAAWLWERGMKLERLRLTGFRGIHWRVTPERILVRLGLAEATDRTAGDVDAHRRLTRVALAIKDAKALQQRGASDRKQRAALAKLDKVMDKAVEHTGLAVNPERQKALLAQIDALYSTGALVKREKVAKWADTTTQEDRERANAALEEMLRFDTAEATQRALDKAALTLMALTERVTSDVTSQRVNGEVNNQVNGGAIPAPRAADKLTLPVSPNVTPVLTIEQVNPPLNFDINNPDLYDLERLLSGDPHVTGELIPALTSPGLNEKVNDDADDGSKTQAMQDFWRAEVAEDRYPTVKELADHAGVHPSHASRKRKEWVAELPYWKRRKADPRRDRSVS